MNKRKSKILNFTVLFFSFLCLNSCKKFVEVGASPYLILKNQVYADSANATSAVLGIYINMVKTSASLSCGNGLTTLYTGLYSDEIVPTATQQIDKEFYVNNLTQNSAGVSALWNDYYRLIFLANDCIDGLQSSTTLPNSVRNQLLGESKVLRAYFYFNLTNLFNDVALCRVSDYNINKALPRISSDSIYKFIISDCLEASQLLTASYPSDGKARINKYAALALLSKLYLYQKLYGKADEVSSEILNSHEFALEQDPRSAFLANSKEAILQLPPLYPGYETGEGFAFVPSSKSTLPKYVLNSILLSSFENQDGRKSAWVDSNVVNGKVYYYPSKYKLRYDGNTTPLEGYVIFRLGEQYLIRAEARIESGNINGGIEDLNQLRRRANLQDLSVSTLSDAEKFLFHERQVELFCEQGNRWFDLKRQSTLDDHMDSVSNAKGGSWMPYKRNFPLYIDDLESNPFLKQTEGY